MNVIFTCGGTGGHINPAIAVAKLLREREPDARILFIGAEGGMEQELVPREGFQLETVKISSFQRRLSPGGIWHNVRTVVNLAGAKRRARQLIRQFQPDVIVGTGGYASFPALSQGAKLGIPTAVHEANAVPGLTTRMVEGHATRMMVNFEESRGHYAHPERVVVTGMPVRSAFLYTKKQDARRALGLDDRPVIVSCWGSLGAREMNRKIADFIALESKEDCFQHIHATGSFGWKWMPDYVREKGVDLQQHPNIDLREYIYDMPTLMAAADLCIFRAGAATLSEIAASGTPAIIIPSPNVTDNHQEKNAAVLAARGAVQVLHEQETDGAALYRAAGALLHDPGKLHSMSRALLDAAVLDAAERIYETMREIALHK